MQQSMFYSLAKFVDSYHIIAYYVINWYVLTFLLVWLDSSISYNTSKMYKLDLSLSENIEYF